MKIIDLIKDLTARVKNLWNVYGGIAISTLIAWLTKWSKDEMDKWSSYILLTITCISLLTFFKVILGRRKKSVSDKIAMQQRNIKTINTALNPEAIGEEIGTAILYTINGGKKMKDRLKAIIKVAYGNKFTTLSLLLNLLYTGLAQYLLYSDTLREIPFFVEHKTVCIIVATSISAIWLIIELVKDIKQLGFESLAELNAKWAARKAAKKDKLTKEQKKLVKEEINSINTKILTVTNYIDDAQAKIKSADAIISKFNDFKTLGLEISNELVNEYQNATNSKVQFTNSIEKLTADKLNLEQQVKSLKARL